MGIGDKMNPTLQTNDTAFGSVSGKKIKSTGISGKPVGRYVGRGSDPNSVFCTLPFQGSFAVFVTLLGSLNSSPLIPGAAVSEKPLFTQHAPLSC